MLKYLRIAVTASSLIAWVLLIALCPSQSLNSWEGIGTVYTVPLWLLVALIATTGVLPWFPWRFSLRTLLIATTLEALGLVVIVF